MAKVMKTEVDKVKIVPVMVMEKVTEMTQTMQMTKVPKPASVASVV